MHGCIWETTRNLGVDGNNLPCKEWVPVTGNTRGLLTKLLPKALGAEVVEG